MEVTEDVAATAGSEKSSNASSGGGARRSLTPRAAAERPASVHEPDAQISRERMVSDKEVMIQIRAIKC